MILALDSSSSQGSVALVRDGRTIRELTVSVPRGRGGALFLALEEILQDRPILDRVAVGTGPGSYNGIRAAISAAWGISAARGIPIVGVSSLLGLGEGTYCAVGDARRGQYYFAAVRDGRFVTEPILLESAELLPRLAGRHGHPIFTCGEIAEVPNAEIRHASAARLARVEGPEGIPEPLYLKPPHITTAKAR